MNCPKCLSWQVTQKNSAKKTGGVIGALAGGSGLINPDVDPRLPIPLSRTAHLLSLAILGGLAGAKLGKLIDQQILDNNLCAACGHCFSDEEDGV